MEFDIVELFSDLGAWTWWVVAALLLVMELLVPGVFFLWLGVAAAVLATNLMFFDISWQGQVASFAVLSLLAVIGSRFLMQRSSNESDRPFLNQRSESMVGKDYVVAEAIADGEGRIRIGDTLWTARGPDTPIGARVRVVAVDDGLLRVEPLPGEGD